MRRLSVLLAGLFLVLGLLGTGVPPVSGNGGTDWPQFHKDAANTGNTSSNAPDSASLVWFSDDINAVESSSVLVADGYVYVYCNGDTAAVDHIKCLNASTGALVWTSDDLSGSSWDSWASPAYHNGKVFMASGTNVYGINASDGTVNWTYAIPSAAEATNGSVTVADGKVFVNDWDGSHYYCLNETDGALIWTFDVSGYAQGTPAYDNGRVYLTSWEWGGNGHVYSVNASSGSQIWHNTAPLPVAGSAAVADDVVYYATYNFGGTGKLYAVNSDNGSSIWETADMQSTDATPAVADGKVYICGGSPGWWDLATYCFATEDGSQLWQVDDIGGWTCSMAAGANAVVVGNLKDPYSGAGSYGTYALDLDTGATIWSSAYGGSSPTVADSKVFTIAQGRVYAFGTPAGNPVDLEAVSISLPTFINNGQANDISAVIKNNGTGTAETIEVTLSANSTVVETETIATLAAGEQVTANFTSWSPDIGDYTLQITVDPDNAIPESDTGNNQLTKAVSVPQMKQGLLTGWNFVATPKKLKDGHKTAGQVFGDVSTDNHSIWVCAAPDGWEALSSDNTVSPLTGIWVYSSGSTEIYFAFDTNPISTPPTKQLYAGWSTIGFSDTEATSANSALTSVESKWAYLIGFDAENQRYDDSIINNTTSGNHSESRSMYPGYGYWIYMTSDGELAAIGN